MIMTKTVLLTDFAWPDDSIERKVIESAGFRLIAGPADSASEAHIDALVAEHQPHAIMTCWAQVSAHAIKSSAPLEIVARLGVGLDNIAVQAATDRGVWVTNVPDYCVQEVSDHAIGFILSWTRGLHHFDREVRAGQWNPASAKLKRLANLTCGIVGFGRIGRLTARKLSAFGCRLLAYDPMPGATSAGVESVGLDTLMRSSDIVVVHAPLLPATHHLIDREKLGWMRPGGLLVNVSRGAVVDTTAVVEALESGQLSAVGLDVLESEPTVPQALQSSPGAMLTPHVAFSSDASLEELRRSAAEEVVRVLTGQVPHQARNQPVRSA
jgi:D-3-phosphoglycerate dehydrogenase